MSRLINVFVERYFCRRESVLQNKKQPLGLILTHCIRAWSEVRHCETSQCVLINFNTVSVQRCWCRLQSYTLKLINSNLLFLFISVGHDRFRYGACPGENILCGIFVCVKFNSVCTAVYLPKFTFSRFCNICNHTT